MSDLAVSVFIGMFAVVAIAAGGMSWSKAYDPKLAFLASLMRKSCRQAPGE